MSPYHWKGVGHIEDQCKGSCLYPHMALQGLHLCIPHTKISLYPERRSIEWIYVPHRYRCKGPWSYRCTLDMNFFGCTFESLGQFGDISSRSNTTNSQHISPICHSSAADIILTLTQRNHHYELIAPVPDKYKMNSFLVLHSTRANSCRTIACSNNTRCLPSILRREQILYLWRNPVLH